MMAVYGMHLWSTTIYLSYLSYGLYMNTDWFQFLDSAKHYTWLDRNIISTTHFQSRVNSAFVPIGIGRIPHKMSGFSSLTADQLKKKLGYILSNSLPSCYSYW